MEFVSAPDTYSFTVEPDSMPTKQDILNRALGLVSKDRNQTHGDAYGQMEKFRNLASIYLGKEMTVAQATTLILLLKISRMESGSYNPDDYVDAVGYAAIAGEARAIEEEQEQ